VLRYAYIACLVIFTFTNFGTLAVRKYHMYLLFCNNYYFEVKMLFLVLNYFLGAPFLFLIYFYILFIYFYIFFIYFYILFLEVLKSP